jgi:ribonucleoside-diphosphate reductase alpha chain
MSKINDLGKQILEAKYYASGETTPDDVFMRVAKNAAIPDVVDVFIKGGSYPTDLGTYFSPYEQAFDICINRRGFTKTEKTTAEWEQANNINIKGLWESETAKYFSIMSNLEFMAATPTLINAGRPLGMLSSCFFLRIPDTMEGIFETVKQVAIISKLGGGVGLDLSDMRPEGSPIAGTNGTSSGPISFLKIFNETGNQVRQGGVRRSAQIAIMRIDHPDIMKFIRCKEIEGNFSNFNISVLVTDDFLKTLAEDGEITLQHPKQPEKTKIKAKELWDIIVTKAWANGEPGVIFYDELNRGDVFKNKFGKLGVNPCVTGETLIAVADERGYVPIKELAKSGEDVIVYCTDKINSLCLRTMRNPRITGHNKKILKIVLTDGSSVRTTEDHKIKLGDNSYLEAKQLKPGMSVLLAYPARNKDEQISAGTIDQVVVSGYEDVYNGTVDDFHNYLIKGDTLASACFISKNCGELPLLHGESCTISAINLGTCIKTENGEVRIDYDKLTRLVHLGVRFLDNIVDINKFPLPEIEHWTLRTRKIGLGVMGLHDVMLRKKVVYGSDESLNLIDKIYSIISREAQLASLNLGEQRGIPQDLKDIGITRRNAGLLTCQPTGTISIICNQASSGIEPVFQWEFTRKDTFGTHRIKHFMLEENPEKLPAYAVTALDIPPMNHVRVQAQCQKYVDSSISKTVNLPNNATREDVENVFNLAYKTKCKSVTIYRSGSRKEEVLIKDKPENKEVEKEPEVVKPVLPSPVTKGTFVTDRTLSQQYRGRSRVLFGATYKINTPGGKAYITINEDDYGIREVFVHISKAGSEIATHVEAEGRLISHALKHGIPADTLINHLAGHRSNPIFDNGRSVKSVPDAVALVMQDFKDNYEGFSEYIDTTNLVAPAIDMRAKGEMSGELCPECGSVLYHASGCNSCTCGFAQCG